MHRITVECAFILTVRSVVRVSFSTVVVIIGAIYVQLWVQMLFFKRKSRQIAVYLNGTLLGVVWWWVCGIPTPPSATSSVPSLLEHLSSVTGHCLSSYLASSSSSWHCQCCSSSYHVCFRRWAFVLLCSRWSQNMEQSACRPTTPLSVTAYIRT